MTVATEATLDIDELLAEISADSPCGEDLEYDAEFAEMERASEGTPEQQFGNTIVEGTPPEWKEVRSKALSLFQRTKDLRVATYLCRALLSLQGFSAFTEGLHLVAELLNRYWDTVHPLLDADDDNDPTIRVNSLAALYDVDTTLKDLKKTPLVSSRLVGRFNLQEIQASQTELGAPAESSGDKKAPDAAVIAAAFQDLEIADLQQLRDMAQQAIQYVTEIENTVTQHVGSGQAVSFGPLRQVLKEILAIYTQQLERRGGGEATTSDDDAASGEESSGVAGTGGGKTRGLNFEGELESREQVVKLIDKALSYYRRAEPSSPVPLLLHRAKRLVNLNFVEILKDLTPDSLTQVQVISGVSDLDSYGGGDA